ncbi:TRAF-like signal transducer [Paramyrothecium foliicola]|nr:TRAF-like signal transducer [Paramyrothecium foliicola]
MSETSDDGYHLNPAAVRALRRRNMRRTSPTPDLVTSLVRPPSPADAFIITPGHVLNRARTTLPVRSSGESIVRSVGEAQLAGRRSGPLRPPHLSSLDIPDKYGGGSVFDLYSLVYVGEPDPNLLCPICHDPLIDPVTTPCDHTFCYRCIRRAFATSSSGTICPIDREPLNWLDCTSAARLIRTQLNSLVVKCPYQNRGCTKELKREAVEAHATTDCSLRYYPCPEISCEKKLRSKPKDDVCYHRDIQCSRCDSTIQEAERDAHLLSCPKAKTRCESCWRLLSRHQLDQHKEVDCEGVEVGCLYQDVGCPVRVMRGSVRAHSLECAFHPDTASGIIIRSQRDVIQSYSDLGSQLREMQAQQMESTKRIEQLEGLTSGVSQRDGNAAVFSDQRAMQDLDAGFEEIHQNLTQLEARQSMWTLNQVMLIREEVTELRNNINMIRMQLNWLRSREEGRMRAASSAGSTTTIRRDSSGEPVPILPERRRSSGAEMDQPRL